MGLSILWFLFSLPLVTAPAAATALYYTYVKVFREQDGTIWKCFWSSFRSNFVQATILGIPLLLICGFWVMTMMKLWHAGRLASPLFLVALILLSFTTVLLHYILSYLARFSDSVWRIFVNTSLMFFVHLPCSLLLFLMAAAAVMLLWFMMPMLPLAIVFLPALYAWATSFFLEKVYQQYMK